MHISLIISLYCFSTILIQITLSRKEIKAICLSGERGSASLVHSLLLVICIQIDLSSLLVSVCHPHQMGQKLRKQVVVAEGTSTTRWGLQLLYDLGGYIGPLRVEHCCFKKECFHVNYRSNCFEFFKENVHFITSW